MHRLETTRAPRGAPSDRSRSDDRGGAEGLLPYFLSLVGRLDRRRVQRAGVIDLLAARVAFLAGADADRGRLLDRRLDDRELDLFLGVGRSRLDHDGRARHQLGPQYE